MPSGSVCVRCCPPTLLAGCWRPWRRLAETSCRLPASDVLVIRYGRRPRTSAPSRKQARCSAGAAGDRSAALGASRSASVRRTRRVLRTADSGLAQQWVFSQQRAADDRSRPTPGYVHGVVQCGRKNSLPSCVGSSEAEGCDAACLLGRVQMTRVDIGMDFAGVKNSDGYFVAGAADRAERKAED